MAKEFVSEDEANPGVYSDTLSFVPLPGEPEVPVEAGFPLSPARASPSDLHGLEAAQLRLLVALSQIFKLLCIIVAHFG